MLDEEQLARITDDPSRHLTLTAGDATLRHGRPGALGSHGGIDDKGNVRLEVDGLPAHGREGEREVAERLVSHLNICGGTWRLVDEERKADDIVDFAAIDASGLELSIQVTRVANESRWALLGQTRSVGEDLDQASEADKLFDSIRKKANSYGPHERRMLDLVVDVMQLPSHTFSPVIEGLKARYGGAIATFGFRSAWVVGSRDDLVFRVDG